MARDKEFKVMSCLKMQNHPLLRDEVVGDQNGTTSAALPYALPPLHSSILYAAVAPAFDAYQHAGFRLPEARRGDCLDSLTGIGTHEIPESLHPLTVF